jgi:phenol 2-monooxygenase
MLEIRLWNPDEQGVIRLSDHIPDTIPGISRFQQVVLHQGRIERFFLDTIKECGGRPVERGVLPTKLSIDESTAEDPDAYPIIVHLKHLSEDEATPKQNATSQNGAAVQDGLFRSNLAADDTNDLIEFNGLNGKAGKEEIVKAKYMLGADGAHSWVRNQLGFKLEGKHQHLLSARHILTLAKESPPTTSGASWTSFPLPTFQTSACVAPFTPPHRAV